MSNLLLTHLRGKITEIDKEMIELETCRRELIEQREEAKREERSVVDLVEEEAAAFGRKTGLIEFKLFLSDLASAIELDQANG